MKFFSEATFLFTRLCGGGKMRVSIIIISVLIPISLASRKNDLDGHVSLAQNARLKEDKYVDLNQGDNSETLIKDKLVSLLMSSKADMAERMKKINSIHDVYKSDKMYKIGYLVSFVNKLYQKLVDAYTNIENHKYSWNTLRILNAYEEVKHSNDYLEEVMRVLNMVVSSNLKILKSIDRTRLKKSPVIKMKSPKLDVFPLTTPPSTNKKMENYDISWSYYDDSMMK